MLYHLLYPLRDYFSALNVFQYITFRAAGAMLTSLLFSLIIGPVIVQWLKRYRIGQTIRYNGPLSHQSKLGTPTMGGLIIIIAVLVSIVLWQRFDNRFTILIFISSVWLGVLGIVDDWLKLMRHQPHGLSMGSKLFWQLFLGILVGAYLWLFPPSCSYATQLTIPFFKGSSLNLGYFYPLLVILVIAGCSNGVNLADGLDGLAIGATVISSATYAVFAYIAGHAVFASYLYVVQIPGAGELAVFLSAVVGAGLGFLWFNSYPAQIFMGDSGSLFLGGSLGIVALLVKQEMLLIVVGGLFVWEALSVIIQVLSFKLSGRRVFLMSPVHHHFELKGWAEPKVVVRFWIINILFAMIALGSLKLR